MGRRGREGGCGGVWEGVGGLEGLLGAGGGGGGWEQSILPACQKQMPSISKKTLRMGGWEQSIRGVVFTTKCYQ